VLLLGYMGVRVPLSDRTHHHAPVEALCGRLMSVSLCRCHSCERERRPR
jgi:hypothetical protein